MKSTNLIAGFAILAALVLVAGCLDSGAPATQMSGSGKDSLDLYIDTEGRTTFDSMEPFIITIGVDNYGPFEVNDVETSLVGYGGITPQDRGTSLSALRTMATKLDKPRPDVDMLGGSATWDWDVYAPFVSEDSPNVEITLTGEVFYRTKSLAKQKLVVVEKEYIDKLTERQEQVPVNPETEAENGPVSVDVEVPNPYVRMVDDQTSFGVKLIVINDGSGNLYARWGGGLGDYDYLEKVTLEVPVGLVADPANCDFSVPANNKYDDIKTLTIDDTHSEGKLRLLEGGSYRELFCRLIADRDYVNGYQTFELYAEADYSYLQDVTRKLIIGGTEEKPLLLGTVFPTRLYPAYWEASPGSDSVFFTLKYNNQPVTDVSAVTGTVSIASAGIDASDEIAITNLVYKPKGKTFLEAGSTCVPSDSEYTADETKVDGFVGCVQRPVAYLESVGDGSTVIMNIKVAYSGQTATDRSYEAIVRN